MEGHTYLNSLMVITCKFSKIAILIPGNKTYTAKEWTEVLPISLLQYD